eukprot:scaffold4939_cov121-Isochrysis_galbana.AAC.5
MCGILARRAVAITAAAASARVRFMSNHHRQGARWRWRCNRENKWGVGTGHRCLAFPPPSAGYQHLKCSLLVPELHLAVACVVVALPQAGH